jgi:hypothetical protein
MLPTRCQLAEIADGVVDVAGALVETFRAVTHIPATRPALSPGAGPPSSVSIARRA